MNTKEQIAQLTKQLATLKATLSKQKQSVKSKKPTADLKATNYAKSLKWYASKGINTVETGFKVTLPTKQGDKVYDAVRFSNGKTGVVLNSGIIKYAWKQ